MIAVEAIAAALIRNFEGLRLAAYQDGGGVWTIGFGHTGDIWPGQPITAGTTITLDQATEFLKQDSAPLFRLVLDKHPIAAAAYVSFGYDCGIGALERVLAGKANLTEFIHDRSGNVEPGLVSRRNLESALIEADS